MLEGKIFDKNRTKWNIIHGQEPFLSKMAERRIQKGPQKSSTFICYSAVRPTDLLSIFWRTSHVKLISFLLWPVLRKDFLYKTGGWKPLDFCLWSFQIKRRKQKARNTTYKKYEVKGGCKKTSSGFFFNFFHSDCLTYLPSFFSC